MAPPPPVPRIRRPSRIRIPRTPTPPRIHCHAQLGPEPRWAQLWPLLRAPFVSRLGEPRRQPPPTHTEWAASMHAYYAAAASAAGHPYAAWPLPPQAQVRDAILLS